MKQREITSSFDVTIEENSVVETKIKMDRSDVAKFINSELGRKTRWNLNI